MKQPPITLTDDERSQLDRLIHTGTSPARTQARARILLLSDAGRGERLPNASVAQAAMVTVQTVIRVRKRYRDEGMDAALYDKPRPGGTPKVTGDIEAKLLMLACSEPPKGRTRWTLRLLADQMVALGYIDSLSNVAVYQRLKKMRSSLGR